MAAKPAQAADDDEIPRIPLLFPVKEAESLLSPIDRRSDFYRQQARHHPPPGPARVRQPLMTIPNVLTFFRLVLVPLLMIFWEVRWKFAPLFCGVVFILASVTDWLDGYLARKLKIATVFGAFLDPVADKVMVATALVLLMTTPPAPLTPSLMAPPVTIIVCREITMSALREWAASAGGGAQGAVKVNSLGKWKTALQMAAMSVLLMLRQPLADWLWVLLPGTGLEVYITEMPLVWAAFAALWGGTVLAMWSLAIYMSNVWTHFVYPIAKQH